MVEASEDDQDDQQSEEHERQKLRSEIDRLMGPKTAAQYKQDLDDLSAAELQQGMATLADTKQHLGVAGNQSTEGHCETLVENVWQGGHHCQKARGSRRRGWGCNHEAYWCAKSLRWMGMLCGMNVRSHGQIKDEVKKSCRRRRRDMLLQQKPSQAQEALEEAEEQDDAVNTSVRAYGSLAESLGWPC